MDLTKPTMNGRMDRIKNAFDLIKATSPIKYFKVVNIICINQGVSANTAREYINILVSAEYVIRKGAELTVKRGVNFNGKS